MEKNTGDDSGGGGGTNGQFFPSTRSESEK